MRPNSTALSEMGSHFGGSSFHISVRIHQLSPKADNTDCTYHTSCLHKWVLNAFYLSLFLLNIYFFLFRQKLPYAWAGQPLFSFQIYVNHILFQCFLMWPLYLMSHHCPDKVTTIDWLYFLLYPFVPFTPVYPQLYPVPFCSVGSTFLIPNILILIH